METEPQPIQRQYPRLQSMVDDLYTAGQFIGIAANQTGDDVLFLQIGSQSVQVSKKIFFKTLKLYE